MKVIAEPKRLQFLLETSLSACTIKGQEKAAIRADKNGVSLNWPTDTGIGVLGFFSPKYFMDFVPPEGDKIEEIVLTGAFKRLVSNSQLFTSVSDTKLTLETFKESDKNFIAVRGTNDEIKMELEESEKHPILPSVTTPEFGIQPTLNLPTVVSRFKAKYDVLLLPKVDEKDRGDYRIESKDGITTIGIENRSATVKIKRTVTALEVLAKNNIAAEYPGGCIEIAVKLLKESPILVTITEDKILSLSVNEKDYQLTYCIVPYEDIPPGQ